MTDRAIANRPLLFSSTGTSRPAARPIVSRTTLLILAGSIGLASVTHAVAGQTCRPALTFTDIKFSEMQPLTLQRTWTAVLSVDVSRCATTSGRFEIGFSRVQENGPEIAFREPFIWTGASVEVSVDFWADEAVERYWIGDVAACVCRSNEN